MQETRLGWRLCEPVFHLQHTVSKPAQLSRSHVRLDASGEEISAHVLRRYLVPEGSVASPSSPAIARTILMGDVLSEITQRIARTANLHLRATRQLYGHWQMPECGKVNRDYRGHHYRSLPAFLRRSISLAIGPSSFLRRFSSNLSRRNRNANSLTYQVFSFPDRPFLRVVTGFCMTRSFGRNCIHRKCLRSRVIVPLRVTA